MTESEKENLCACEENGSAKSTDHNFFNICAGMPFEFVRVSLISMKENFFAVNVESAKMHWLHFKRKVC